MRQATEIRPGLKKPEAARLAMLLPHRFDVGLRGSWLVAALYVAASGAAWLLRYFGGAWESMRVVETVVVEAK